MLLQISVPAGFTSARLSSQSPEVSTQSAPGALQESVAIPGAVAVRVDILEPLDLVAAPGVVRLPRVVDLAGVVGLLGAGVVGRSRTVVGRGAPARRVVLAFVASRQPHDEGREHGASTKPGRHVGDTVSLQPCDSTPNQSGARSWRLAGATEPMPPSRMSHSTASSSDIENAIVDW